MAKMDWSKGADRSQKLDNQRGLPGTGNASSHGPVTHIDPSTVTVDPPQPLPPMAYRIYCVWAREHGLTPKSLDQWLARKP